MQICLKFNVFALQYFLGGHYHKSAPSTPRNPNEDQWDISALEREKVNKAIEFMFVLEREKVNKAIELMFVGINVLGATQTQFSPS